MTEHSPLRLGMVGGGAGAMIGNVHRIAARLDGQFDLVAAALSSDPDRAAQSAAALGIARSYGDYKDMAVAEAARADGIDAVAICTPNHLHFPVARAFLAQGIHVICDKPMTATLDQALQLAEVARDAKALFILTHNYSAYPQIRQARAMIARGDLGALRLVQVEYAQDWLTEDSDSKQAAWRTDPARAGGGGAIGDIGTHAFQLAGFVTGLRPDRLAADLSRFVPGRQLDDNAHILLRYPSGARGMIWVSQVAPGTENGLRLRIYGDKGGLEWQHDLPETLTFTRFGEPAQILRRGGPGNLVGGSRVPPGHPEGYLEGFANLYTEAAEAIRSGAIPDTLPGIADGLAGLRFIDACLRSDAADTAWVEVAA